MMKPSDLWTLLHLTQLFEVVGAIFRVAGGVRTPESDKDKIFNHVFGIFGTGDEKVLCVRLDGLKATTDESYVDDIIGYLKYAFPQGTTGQRIESWRSGNSFRKFITENDNEAMAVGFLKWMVDTIREKNTKEEGFRHLAEKLATLGIPHYNASIAGFADATIGNLGRAGADFKVKLENTATAIDQKVADERAKPKPLFSRLIQWI